MNGSARILIIALFVVGIAIGFTLGVRTGGKGTPESPDASREALPSTGPETPRDPPAAAATPPGETPAPGSDPAPGRIDVEPVEPEGGRRHDPGPHGPGLRTGAGPGAAGSAGAIRPHPQETGCIRGRVIVPPDYDPGKLVVFLSPGTCVGAPYIVRVSKKLSKPLSSGAGTEFSFEGLAKRKYTLGVSFKVERDVPDFTDEGLVMIGGILAWKIVDLTGSLAETVLQVPAPDLRDSVVLWVLGPDGKPLQDVQVGSDCAGSDGDLPFGLLVDGSVLRRPDGSYSVSNRGLDEDGHPVENPAYAVTIHAKKYGWKRIIYEPGNTTVLRTRFSEPAQLEITCGQGGTGDFPGDLWVHLEFPRTRTALDRWYQGIETNYGLSRQGSTEIAPVQPGPYEFVLTATPSMGERHVELHRRLLDVVSGRNQVSVDIPHVYALNVVLRNPESDSRIVIRRVSDGSAPEFEDGDDVDQKGEVTFPLLLAGEYRISLEDSYRSGEMFVRLPGPSAVELVPKPFNAIRISMKGPPGEWQRAGFKDGDLIVAIDGVEFVSGEQMRILLDAAMDKADNIITISRSGARSDIRFPFKSPWEEGVAFTWTSR